MVKLQNEKKRLHTLSITVAAIGIGQPKHARRYCSQLAPDILCFATGNNETYFSYGVHQASLKELMATNVFKAAARNIIHGNIGGKPTGDIRLLSATFMIDRQGIILYAYYGKDVSDHPDPSSLGRDQ